MDDYERELTRSCQDNGGILDSYDAYSIGYHYGRHSLAVPLSIIENAAISEEYRSDFYWGYEDGEADRFSETSGQRLRPVDNAYSQFNNAPDGFTWAYEKRVPKPGEYYLSKNGSANRCLPGRVSSQLREILNPISDCTCSYDVGSTEPIYGFYHAKKDCPLCSRVKNA
jgi:hypothetical protein